MFLSWFDTREARKAGQALADYFAGAYPRSDGRPGKKEVARQEKASQMLLVQARAFGQAQRPNFYQRAKFGEAFQSRLAELGFEGEVLRTATREVLVCLNQA